MNKDKKEKGWIQVKNRNEVRNNARIISKKNHNTSHENDIEERREEKKEITKEITKEERKDITKKLSDSCDSISSDSDDNNSLKKILCHNMIYNGECKYGDKCLYAHSLKDQNVNKKRKEVYDILKNNSDLSNINLRENYDLYKTMLELTKYCKNCNSNSCIGGYNCKSGVYDKKYCICINDLNYGECYNNNCQFVHLSKRKLKPYFDDKIDKKNKKKSNTYMSMEEKLLDIRMTLSERLKNTIESDDNIGSDISDLDLDNDVVTCINNEEIINGGSDIDKYKYINDYKSYINMLCNKSIFV
jgi:hypothetical protein